MKRERTLHSWDGETGRTEEVVFRLQDAYFTIADGQRKASMSHGLWSLFLSSQLREHTEVEGDMYYQRFIIPPQQFGTWAYQALVTMLGLQQGIGQVSNPGLWQRILKRHDFPFTLEELRTEARAGFGERVTQYIFDRKPDIVPTFLDSMSGISGHGRGADLGADDA